MSTITLNLSSAGLAPYELDQLESQVSAAAQLLDGRQGPGNEFLGWLDLPVHFDPEERQRIQAAAKKIQEQSQVMVVVGIGGSYLGSRAAVEFCRPTPPLPSPLTGRGTSTHLPFAAGNEDKSPLPSGEGPGVALLYAGTNLSGSYHAQLLDLLDHYDFSVNVISKSGTTTEPAIAFRLLRQKLEKKYGPEGARARIYATTDAHKGALKTLADQEGYATFTVPDDVGGRFSVLTAVGLLPIAAAGIDTEALLNGAGAARTQYASAPYAQNDVLRYAAARNLLLRKGKAIELMVSYEPRCQYVAEWWKQLFGESEGKDGKGLFPASVGFTTDLHSLGQYIQDGRRHLFETVLEIEKPGRDLILEKTKDDLDGLNYLAGKSMDYVNKKAAEGTRQAHMDGGVPNLVLHIPEATPHCLGQLFYFFEKACAVSGYLLGVNPFDQPGVEAYKKNMFALLGKK